MQQLTPSHKYVNIDYGHNESALVTSQFQIEQYSPNRIIELPSSNRNLDQQQQQPKQKSLSATLKSKAKHSLKTRPRNNSIEKDQLVDNLHNPKSPTLILNQHQLPEYHTQPLSLKSLPFIFHQLEVQALQHQFFCISKSNTQLLFMHQMRQTLKDQLSTIFCTHSNINCLLLVKYHDQQILIKSLAGNYKKNEDLIQAFIAILHQFTHSPHHSADDKTAANPINDYTLHSQEQDIYQNPYYLNMMALTMIYKHLNDTTILDTLISSIKLLKNPTNKQIQEQMNQAANLCTSLYESIISESNTVMTKTQNHPLYPYYKLSIEKFVFSRLHDDFIQIYVAKYKEKERVMQEKKKQIKSTMNPMQIMKFLDIKDRFTTLSPEQRRHYANEGTPTLQIDPPYIRGIRELEQIVLNSNPREKLRCIQQMICQVKSDAVEYNKIKEELSAMDDELPIVIYITLISEFDNQYAQLQYIDDFANTDPTIENERRLLTNIRVSLDYIANEWQV